MKKASVNKGVTTAASGEVVDSLQGLLREGLFRCIPNGKLLFCNSALALMFGYPSARAVIGVPLLQLVADEQEGDHLLRAVFASGRVEGVRMLLRKRNGENFWCLVSLKATHLESGVVFDGCLLEITAWQQTEDQLVNARIKLEKITAELDRFIYSASHTMRSPITSMKGLLYLLKAEKPSDLSVSQYVGLLGDTLGKLERYVDELSGFAKAANQKVSDKIIDPSQFLETTLQAVRNHLNFSRVTVNISVRHHGVFYTDPECLRTVLLNVLKNCYDYYDVNKAQNVLAVDFVAKADKAVIEVFDNGIGISAGSIERVFDLFYRATTVSTGPGFGLYIAREAAARIGGTISLNSEHGIGTSVRIEIPNSGNRRLEGQSQLLRSS